MGRFGRERKTDDMKKYNPCCIKEKVFPKQHLPLGHAMRSILILAIPFQSVLFWFLPCRSG